ncbi:hypothetical protein C2S51_017528 [Perilla frutescens var. frutescens]|nr:hypothetical protein C2S51_017528 [Perilla frutescens var. frutescens]
MRNCFRSMANFERSLPISVEGTCYAASSAAANTEKGDLSVDEFFLKMRGFAYLLSAAGQAITDDELLLYILAGFGIEYDAVVVNLTHRAGSVDLQEAQFVLQSHEMRVQSYPASQFFPCANLANQRQTVYNHPGGHGHGSDTRGRGSFFRGRGGGGRGYTRDPKLVCQLCGKTGHVTLKCFKCFDVHFTGCSNTQGANEGNTGKETIST